MPSTMAASKAFSSGTKAAAMPISLALKAAVKTPLTLLMLPSRESSPMKKQFRVDDSLINSSAARIPTAMGKSNAVPSFFMSAGARLTVT